MLLALRIRNFALIDRLDREFGEGLNVLTGETGAGKSIILDAIDVVLGGKASGRLLRAGSQRGSIEATFALTPGVAAWLTEQEIELLDEESFVCFRQLTQGQRGVRSRSRINGVLVNRQAVEQLRDRLVEITAQGQTVQLFLPAKQRDLLDAFGGETLLEARAAVAEAYASYKKSEQELEKRRNCDKERLQRLDWLQYQLKELDTAEIEDVEEQERLEGERDRLSHVVELQQSSYQAYQLLYQSDRETAAAADLLGDAEQILTEMTEYDGQLTSLLELVREALTQASEAGKQLYDYGERLEADPERLGEVEERLRVLKQICRKYGPELADAIAHHQELHRELEELDNSSDSLEALEKAARENQEILDRCCEILSQRRQTAASNLEQTLIRELKPLAMDKVKFECRLTPAPASATGSDRVDYYFSPNPGEAVQPLSTTASGGEMSRFLLALKACFAPGMPEQNPPPLPERTLIFDEIDAGVSGKVAGAIAEKLHQLSQHHQILCVTHQPIVAAMADTHFRVDKETVGEPLLVAASDTNGAAPVDLRTVVRIVPLDTVQTRREELAQLAGGHSSQNAIAFAETLLTQAAQQRKPARAKKINKQ